MRKKMTAIFLIFCALFVFGNTGIARAAYPDRPISIIIPFGPGGAVDIAARIIAEHLKVKHGVAVNVVCKGGGAGAPAMLEVAKARPDGYTYGFPALASFSTTPQIKSCGYSVDDFKAVAQVTVMWLSLAVSADSGIGDVNGLVDLARKNPGKVNYGTHGALSAQRLFMLRLQEKAFPDVELVHVGYTSGHDVSTALLGKHITSAFGVTTNQKPYVLSGDFRIIGVSSPERLPEFPDAPTFAEQFGDEFVFAASHGLVAPKKVPDDRIEIMQNLIKDALADPEVREKFQKAGLTTDYLPADEFQKSIMKVWELTGETLKENKLL